jgi:hypothetical protein
MTLQEFVLAMQPQFPRLTVTNCRVTSPIDGSYNCIAWAAGDTDFWWWPDSMGQAFWPDGVPRVETLAAFEQAYGIQGYSERTDASLDLGKQKIAIYSDREGKPTHAARQLPDGWWASKLGESVDIEHDLSALDGPVYGTVALILARPSR